MENNQIERNQAYTLALAAAKSEYDEIVVDWEKLVARVNALRHAMKGLAHLLDEELADKYQFIVPKPQPSDRTYSRDTTRQRPPSYPNPNPNWQVKKRGG